ncbi:MAG: hypothetical protein ACXAD7_02865 [Candidatus Kariarchaeaceae archaeon]|jgi:hypothetical protein
MKNLRTYIRTKEFQVLFLFLISLMLISGFHLWLVKPKIDYENKYGDPKNGYSLHSLNYTRTRLIGFKASETGYTKLIENPFGDPNQLEIQMFNLKHELVSQQQVPNLYNPIFLLNTQNFSIFTTESDIGFHVRETILSIDNHTRDIFFFSNTNGSLVHQIPINAVFPIIPGKVQNMTLSSNFFDSAIQTDNFFIIPEFSRLGVHLDEHPLGGYSSTWNHTITLSMINLETNNLTRLLLVQEEGGQKPQLKLVPNNNTHFYVVVYWSNNNLGNQIRIFEVNILDSQIRLLKDVSGNCEYYLCNFIMLDNDHYFRVARNQGLDKSDISLISGQDQFNWIIDEYYSDDTLGLNLVFSVNSDQFLFPVYRTEILNIDEEEEYGESKIKLLLLSKNSNQISYFNLLEYKIGELPIIVDIFRISSNKIGIVLKVEIGIDNEISHHDIQILTIGTSILNQIIYGNKYIAYMLYSALILITMSLFIRKQKKKSSPTPADYPVINK